MQVQGTVEAINIKQIQKAGKYFGKNTFALKLAGDDRWFSSYTNDPRIQKGQPITFEVKQNGDFWNLDVKTIIRGEVANVPSNSNNSVGTAPVGNQVNKGESSAKSYNKTQVAIQFQASRNAAIEALSLAVAAGVKLPVPTKTNEQLDAVLSLIDEITDRYFKATSEASEEPGAE